MHNSIDTCLFCRVLTGELDAKIIAETDHAVAFLDLHPQSPGHTLVIPKVHAETLIDLPREEAGPLFELVRDTVAQLQDTLDAPGMTIGVNQGIIAGQGVPHLHVHLMPRFEGDGAKSIHVVVKNKSTPDQEELINSLIV